MENFFAILGGMGTLATTNFITKLNSKHTPKKDQDFFDYVLFNHAEIPDRTAYILDPSKPSPLPVLLEDIEKINMLNPDFMIIPCNTAHYFIEDLQNATSVPIINMIEETVKAIPSLLTQSSSAKHKIGVAASAGTLKSKLYQDKLTAEGYEVILPPPALQEKITELIYSFVKEQSIINLPLYESILEEFEQLGSELTLLGCTELSLVNSHDLEKKYPVVDAENILLERTYESAQKLKAQSRKERSS